MNQDRLNFLFEKYIHASLDSFELEEFSDLISKISQEEFFDLVDQYVLLESDKTFDSDAIYSKVKELTKEPQSEISSYVEQTRFSIQFCIKIAAVFVSFFFICYIFYQYNFTTNTDDSVLQNTFVADSLSESAMIRLADGTSINLTAVAEDSVSYKGLTIVKNENGVISISKDSKSDLFEEDANHYFASPKGMTLQLKLPDESIVALNSGSSLEISSSYGSKNRNVKLLGEGYFDVVHDKNLPFQVLTKYSTIEVFGTSFNVSAYEQDNDVKTTLIHGSVAVNTSKDKIKIIPNQQAVVKANSSIEIISNADLNHVLAWRDGYFRFKNESVSNILYELGKWYDIEGVSVSENVKDKFTGSLKRTNKLKDVLDGISEISDLKFTIKEGRVDVSK